MNWCLSIKAIPKRKILFIIYLKKNDILIYALILFQKKNDIDKIISLQNYKSFIQQDIDLNYQELYFL